MNIFSGKRDHRAGTVSVFTIENGKEGSLDPRHDLAHHSDSFEWGYPGSAGPAQLAIPRQTERLVHLRETRVDVRRRAPQLNLAAVRDVE